MKYYIKPLGMTKTQGFCQEVHGCDLFLYLQGLREQFSGMTQLKGILKFQQIFAKATMITQLRVAT